MGLLQERTHLPAAIMMLPDSGDVQRFRNEIPQYLHDYRAYLEEKREYETATSLTVRLECVVVNDGYAPAEGMRIVLHVPDGPEVFDKDSLPQPPESPDPPVAPRTTTEIMLGRMAIGLPNIMPSFDFLHNTPRIAGESRAPRIKKTNSFVVEYSRRELQHRFEARFDPFHCVFRSPDAVRSFSIDYEIHAKNLAEPVTGRVDLILQVESAKDKPTE